MLSSICSFLGFFQLVVVILTARCLPNATAEQDSVNVKRELEVERAVDASEDTPVKFPTVNHVESALTIGTPLSRI